jgi:outer membrane lipoprotein-sorting protein
MTIYHILQPLSEMRRWQYEAALKDDPRGLFMYDGEWYVWHYDPDSLDPVINQVYRVESKTATQVFKLVRIEKIDKGVTIVKGESGFHLHETLVQVDWDWYLRGDKS